MRKVRDLVTAASLGALAAVCVLGRATVHANTGTAPNIYGDGSAGNHEVTQNEDWTTAPPTNFQFTNLTVHTQATLTVPSGTVIRCLGSFTNKGAINVVAPNSGGLVSAYPPADFGFPHYRACETGVARSRAENGQFIFSQGDPIANGAGGVGLFEVQARQLLRPGVMAGGGGAGNGGDGGGSLVILAGSSINNQAGAVINANGLDAPPPVVASGPPPVRAGGTGGGGGGGVVILASSGSVTNSGAVSANGGAGGNAVFAGGGAGGGGGGGIVHLLAPTIANTGTTSVVGGAGGAGATRINANFVLSTGSGGGGCGGSGGTGGVDSEAYQVFGDNNYYKDYTAGSAGTAGLSLQSQLDPAFIY